jgi:hypothetical protein
MILLRQTIGVGGRRGSGRLVAVLGALVAAVALAACKATSPSVPGNPVIVFTLDSAVPQGDTIHGEVVATGDRDLTSLEITVYDTGGTDSIPEGAGGGTSSAASRLDDKFTWKIRHILPGDFVRFSAIAFDFYGDSTIVRDSTLVKP